MQASEKEFITRAGFAEVYRLKNNGQHYLVATRAFGEGEIICSFAAQTVSKTPTYLTVQVDAEKHITLSPSFLQYINHSCVPNVFFDTANGKLMCIRAIAAHQEMTFFYPSTEWKMAQPFLCQCGHSECLQIIQGAAFLDHAVLKKYRLTHFIENRLREHSKAEIR